MRAGKRSDGMGNKGRDEAGFTYVALLIFIAILGVGLAATGEVWHMAIKREKEAELLFVGNQFRTAIAMYYLRSPGRVNRYPGSLEDLLKDPRYPGTVRYLRKIYLDPMTNSADWGLVKGANGEILGIHSTSEEEPAKKGNFDIADRGCEGKTKYSDWVFTISSKYFPPNTAAALSGAPAGGNGP